MEKIFKPAREDAFFIDKSFIEKGKNCVHVPANIPKMKGVSDIKTDIDELESNVHKKYSELTFTGLWGTAPDEKGIDEYLFFFK